MLLEPRSTDAAETSRSSRGLGVGPKWALVTAAYFAASVAVHAAAYPRFVIAWIPPAAAAIGGAALVAAGAGVYVAALLRLRRGLRRGRLVTGGLYSVVRHPLYASGVFLMVPGVALAIRSWLLVPLPVVACAACRGFLPAEDEALRARYGHEFERYRDTTNALFPMPPWWRRGREPGRDRKEQRMASLPDSVRQAWDDRNGPIVLATVSPEGVPNIIYAGCVGAFGEDRLVVADNYFHKTRQNLQAGGPGAILFRSKDGKAYQVKGTLEYHTDGEVFDDMKTWNPSQHPGHAAAALRVEEVYSGAEKLA